MGKHKLHMTSKSSKKKKLTKNKKPTKKKVTKKKIKIIDVPLSKGLSEGSKATLGYINYHYQKYYNTFTFIKEIISRNKKLQKQICIPDIGKGWMLSFLKAEISSKSVKSIKPVDSAVSERIFMKEIKRCMKKQLVPINFEIIVPLVGTHANIIIIDTKQKTIELFEPHGNRGKNSELESISEAYLKVSKKIQRFFKQHFPTYTYIPPSKFEPKHGLQGRLDFFSGLCVTWSILYLHYRLLNPDVNPKTLVSHIDKKMNKTKLLQYTRYVEDILKHKI